MSTSIGVAQLCTELELCLIVVEKIKNSPNLCQVMVYSVTAWWQDGQHCFATPTAKQKFLDTYLLQDCFHQQIEMT